MTLVIRRINKNGELVFGLDLIWAECTCVNNILISDLMPYWETDFHIFQRKYRVAVKDLGVFMIVVSEIIWSGGGRAKGSGWKEMEMSMEWTRRDK